MQGKRYLLYCLEDRSRPEEFYRTGVFKNFEKFTRKQLCRSFSFDRLQVGDLQLSKKSDCGTGVSCELCKIFMKTFL